MAHEIPQPIRVAVGQLSGIPGVDLESHPEFIPAETSWAFRLRLTSARHSEFVPEETLWVALVDPSYPDGRIRIYPDKSNGLVCTFPHQDRNVLSKLSHATWRTGKPCLDSPSQRLGRIAGGPEPKGDVEQRLRWHVVRCLAWLDVAAADKMMVSGDPFEIPQCPPELIDSSFTVVHDEGEDTWLSWKERIGQCGEVHWGIVPGFNKTIVADEFRDDGGTRIRCCRRRSQPSDKPLIGYWWLWPSPIVIPPWHAPGTWNELRQIGARAEVDVDRFIRWIAPRAAGKEAVIILLGYTIPMRWNGAPAEVHWQAFKLPQVPAKIEPMNGFRANSIGRNDRLRRDIFGGEKNFSYLKTANWHPDRLQARGRFPSEVRTRSVAVIGAGALGSAVAELLVRGGVTDMLVIDPENLEAGNLVRHTLTGTDLGRNKATATAERLQGAAPMSRIKSCAAPLPPVEKLQAFLEPFKVVLDCTGDDDVLRLLSEAWWPIPRFFLSASLGYEAHRLYLFGAHACRFPFEEFEATVRPWLVAERSQWSEAGETLEGTGCWSPLFPARCDDVWLAAVVTAKHLERIVTERVSNGLLVLEQRSGESLAGYRPAELDSDMNPTGNGVDG